MVHTTENRYIVRDDAILSGEPIIAGTRISVRAIVEEWRLGHTPETIPDLFPHLSLAQVFDALSYFADHADEINEYIAQNRIPHELLHPLVRDM